MSYDMPDDRGFKPPAPANDRRVRVYEDDAHEWRWQRVAMNGQIVADSGEGYTRMSDATEAAEREFPDDLLIIDHGSTEDDERSPGSTTPEP
jgi:uncharacterized protein YegP (UPF0339 family)